MCDELRCHNCGKHHPRLLSGVLNGEPVAGFQVYVESLTVNGEPLNVKF